MAPRGLVSAVFASLVAACTSIGPGTVPHDRIDYGTSIGNSWKEQTLLNIVKLRYADMPIFLEIAQVIAGYQLQSALTGSFTLGNFTANLIDRLTAAGTATAGSAYTDRPTVVYQPLTGVDFLKRLMTPVPPSSVLFMLQSGYAADRIMPIMLDSISGINNESNRLRRAADPKFTRLVELLREGQLAGAIQIRIERPKDGGETSVLIFGPSKDPQLAAKGAEIKGILGIKPDLRELKVNYGGYSGRDDIGIYPRAREDQARSQLDGAEAQVQHAQASLEQTRQALGPKGADNPQIQDALAALEQARLDLTRTTLVAPGDGVVSNLQLNVGQFAAAGQPALTFLDARLVWLNAFLRENSLEFISPGVQAEVALDVLPGRVLPARVESVGWGVGEGDVDPTTGLPKTHQNTGGWLAPAQRFPVQLAFETADGPPRGVRYNARASVILYTGDHPVFNALAWLWIRVIAVLTYVS